MEKEVETIPNDESKKRKEGSIFFPRATSSENDRPFRLPSRREDPKAGFGRKEREVVRVCKH
jgi:hypothetical protein